FSKFCNKTANLLYSDCCYQECKNLFGCIGLFRKSYCILNKQYSKEEYEALVPKIIEHMRKTGEWGEYFPIEISPFGYNETVAQEYYPLTEEEVTEKGYKWHRENDQQEQYLGPPANIPDDVSTVDESICRKIL